MQDEIMFVIFTQIAKFSSIQLTRKIDCIMENKIGNQTL